MFDTIKALSDKTRFNIVLLLLENDLCVGALANKLNISKAAVSQHLQLLRKAGIATGEKKGYFTHYYINKDVLKNVANQFNELSELTQIKRLKSDKPCRSYNKEEIDKN